MRIVQTALLYRVNLKNLFKICINNYLLKRLNTKTLNQMKLYTWIFG